MSEKRADGHPPLEAEPPFVRRLAGAIALTDDELTCLESLHDRRREIATGVDLMNEGEVLAKTSIVVAGWGLRYKLLEDGRRQILNLVLPGDVVGLFASLFDHAGHSVKSLTPMLVAQFEPQRLLDVFALQPRLGAAFCWMAGREDAMLGEQLVRIGRRSAYERVAHLLLELCKRLEAVGWSQSSSFELPVAQEILADTLGLSLVHVNRTLQRLKRDGIVDTARSRVVILDGARLAEIADFDPEYVEVRALPHRTQAEMARLDGG